MPILESTDTALLVIDMQRALFERESRIYNADRLLTTVNALIDRAHHAELPVIFFQHINKGVLRKGAPGWRLHPDLHKLERDASLEKRRGSAFEDTLLDDRLQSRRTTRLVICGLTTHGCIRATCKDALRHGYRTVLPADAHSSYHAEASSQIDLWNSKLRLEGATVVDARTILFHCPLSPSTRIPRPVQSVLSESDRSHL